MSQRTKLIVALWLCVWPIVSLIGGVFAWWGSGIPLLVRTAITAGIIVALMVLVIVPTLSRLFATGRR